MGQREPLIWILNFYKIRSPKILVVPLQVVAQIMVGLSATLCFQLFLEIRSRISTFAVGWYYIYCTPATISGNVYAAVNSASVQSPYPTFDSNTPPYSYVTNTFIEAAINLTDLLGSIDPCSDILIKTIFVKTKSSPGNSPADEFIAPLQVNNLNIGNANAGADKVLTCTVTSVVLDGSSTTPGATFHGQPLTGIFIRGNHSSTYSQLAGTYTLTITDPTYGCKQQMMYW